MSYFKREATFRIAQPLGLHYNDYVSLINRPLFHKTYRFFFKNQLRNKPHLHIKGANKLKMMFIPLKFSGICRVLTLSSLLFLA